MNNNKVNETDLAMFINDLTFLDYLDRFKMLASSLFTWKNLDKVAGVGASEWLELILYEDGRACFVKDNEIGFKVFRVNPDDKFNIYNQPTKVKAYSIGYNKNYEFDEIVYIKNNTIEMPTYKTLQLLSNRLYETERTIDVNLKAQKTPILIEGDTKSILSLKNVYMKYDGNVPVIFGNKNFEISNKLNVLNTQAPYLIDKLENHKHELWNEGMTFLGINNANTDKKERLITSEVESNTDLVNYYLNCFYKTRKRACDEINEKFLKGSSDKVSIELNGSLVDLIEETKNIVKKESGNNGSLHNNNQNINK